MNPKKLKLFKCLALIFSIFLSSIAFANENPRAQGYYYKAKSLYESGDGSAAISYIEQAQNSLDGSNTKLQYLKVMCYVQANNWVEAKKELDIFFELSSGSKTSKEFGRAVEKLTRDEEIALTKIMIEIEEKAELQAFDKTPEGIEALRQQKVSELYKIEEKFSLMLEGASAWKEYKYGDITARFVDFYIYNDHVSKHYWYKSYDKVGSTWKTIPHEVYREEYRFELSTAKKFIIRTHTVESELSIRFVDIDRGNGIIDEAKFPIRSHVNDQMLDALLVEIRKFQDNPRYK